ncbi:sugar ABC transporter permease, partial [candidate division KSB3 bacterium]
MGTPHKKHVEQQRPSSKGQFAEIKHKITSLLLEYGIFVAFFVLCIVLAFASPYFLLPKNLINVLRQVSINGFLSIGMTFVILTGGIDLSVGSVLAFGGIVGASLASSSVGTVYSTPIAILVGLLGGTALGAVTGFFIAKWRMSPFVVSLGMLSIARGLTYIYSDGMPVPKLETSFLYIGQGRIAGIPLPVIIFVVVFIVSWIILYKTRFGRYIYAVGGNEKSARISGVNTRLVIFIAYVISGFLSALGGLTLSARTSAGLPQAG